MNLKNQPPVFVPRELWGEIEKMSKAALIDMVWDYATQVSASAGDVTAAMDEFRKRREIILSYRKREKATSCPDTWAAEDYAARFDAKCR
jgi:hypothetical protein